MNGHQWSGQGWSKIEREERDFGLKSRVGVQVGE
jgi:hypothetical protein